MQLLREFGVPLAEPIAVKDATAAVTGRGPSLLSGSAQDRLARHRAQDRRGRRTRRLRDPAAVRAAFRRDARRGRSAAPSARLDGALVQRMIPGGREMILGVKTDPLFVPAVLCGFGGIFVEQLRDVSLRVPPIAPPTRRR